MAITRELLLALDDLLQTGAQASAKLRAALEAAGARVDVVSQQETIISNARTAERSEQSLPQIVTQARAAVAKLGEVAAQIGDTSLANALKIRVDGISEQMKAAGIGTPWMMIVGVGAGIAALYYLYQHFNGTKALGLISHPDEEEQIGPRVRMLGKALGTLRPRLASSSQCRQLGRGKRSMGDAEKYEFEPEIRLEGHRGSRRRRNK